jgi:hypothetical protein
VPHFPLGFDLQIVPLTFDRLSILYSEQQVLRHGTPQIITGLTFKMYVSVPDATINVGVRVQELVLATPVDVSPLDNTYLNVIFGNDDFMTNNLVVGTMTYEILAQWPSEPDVYKLFKGTLTIPPFLTDTY